MPFSATDEAGQALSAGLTEDLVAKLALASDMRVIAGSHAASRAVRELRPGPVSRELGARYTITGSVRRRGSALRISAHLTDAISGTHLRTEQASVEPAETTLGYLALERIVHALDREVRIAEGVRAELAGEVDTAALLARGRAILLQSDTLESEQRACRFFERTLTLDRTCIAAMAGLGATLTRIATRRWSSDPISDEGRADKLLRLVLEAAPRHLEANAGMGLLLRWQGRLVEAVELLQLSTEIDPTDPYALTHLGLANMYTGHPEIALPCIERALKIYGNMPPAFAHWAMGACHQSLGHSEAALTWLLKARARNRLLPCVRLWLAGALGQIGELDEARQELSAARSLTTAAACADLVTLSAFRSHPALQHPEFVAQQAGTLFAGLRKAGMPEG